MSETTNEKILNLSHEDRKELGILKRPGDVVPIYGIAAGTVIAMIIVAVSDVTVLVPTAIIIISIAIFLALSKKMNGKYETDLDNGKKKVILEKVEKKEKVQSAEAGSAVLPGKKANVSERYYIYVNGVRYSIKEELYNLLEEGETVEMHYTAYSNTLLGFHKQVMEFL